MYKPERLMAFCDGVIAIAITLLVLGLEVPSVHDVPDQQLSKYLLRSLDPLIGYVTSFILVGTYWVQHYVIFHYITHVDRSFIALNGLFLLSVSFVPFPTGLQACYRQDKLAMVFYAGSQAFCGLCLLAIWIYATGNHRLIPSDTSRASISSMTRRISVTPLVSLGAIGASFINLELSRLLFLIVPAVHFSHRLADEGWKPSGGDPPGT